ncbi:MAG: hypothetical protein KME11_03070 [Timaviella obliquedivisa GSE-PSE-MK23-08B]|jgi:uncharacterized membrane protein YciS (DUF1049 family)|nr:hypothetical protein [Timaviella obliquedivisa GSE-PSE-MK23-08B]MBW4514189.1 hypothetical protein [Timaviella obliquedivisa GSE-PSE-MK23-08B]
MNSDITGFIFGAIGCSVTVGTILWRVILIKVNSEMLLLRHDLEKKDLQISNLQDVQSLSHNGFKEKFSHFSERIRTEVVSIEKQVKHIDHYLSKTTSYETRE